ncbi:MAG: 1-acyl-sn-glycerol-3-phosphate acyltransferase [Bacteroidetes Order II. Incertae sedis bacterium]|jgi:1-acyl-sn-glycerol-3-phosphate acyltransferase|nr:1-acyl-sn-glycerol-3-phosphate acyltransferase [Bacteroidetes Order II. bacterium]MDG2016274.1 lysophospholipid acyltransferase family protein [Rhodothermales bacterium]HAY36537.1 hypothetical protein [Bacteroidota bacterium]MBT5249257.1 1-acyl-sn-glycerol-3-phosphate acyltransferase [Bacteroidetes Order II. bacterium]MBT6201419.1 1-acyl-sn-glycerol-3-phosphate acyltransferase [Bacteroidetes Order II. bacterium]
MIRSFRFIRFLIIMLAYSADIMWRGRKMGHAERMAFAAQRQRDAGVSMCRSLRITTEVVGHYSSEKPSLIVPNHIGTLDPWILAGRFNTAFVAKSELGGWPVFGWVCKAVGIIFAHRKNVMRTNQTVDEIRARMRSGVAVLIFPEGTTSDGKELLPFKTGGFESVANMDDGFVVPVYFHVRTIDGKPVTELSRVEVTWSSPQKMTANLWKVLGLGRLHFVVRIGKPIPAKNQNRKELARSAKDAMQQLKQEEEDELLKL